PTDVVGDGVAVRRGDDLPARHLAFVDGPVDVGTVSGGRLQQCGQSDVEGVFGGVFQQDLGAAGEGAVEIDQFRLGSGGSAGGFDRILDDDLENASGSDGDYDTVKNGFHRMAGEKAIAEEPHRRTDQNCESKPTGLTIEDGRRHGHRNQVYV